MEEEKSSNFFPQNKLNLFCGNKKAKSGTLATGMTGSSAVSRAGSSARTGAYDGSGEGGTRALPSPGRIPQTKALKVKPKADSAVPSGPIGVLFNKWCGAGAGQKGSAKARSVDFKEFTAMLAALKLKVGTHKAREIFAQANRRADDPTPDGDTNEMDWDEFEFAVKKVLEVCKADPTTLVTAEDIAKFGTREDKRAKLEQEKREADAAAAEAEEARAAADAAAQALREAHILGKPSCPKPTIGMRVKLAKDVPTFLRDLSEPAVRNLTGGHRRPPPLIGTVVRVVGDPLEQKRVHSFKYRRCNQSGKAVYPCAMWCDVRWDAPSKGEEVTITGYHTGRFGMHYLLLVTEEEDIANHPKNIRLREENEAQLALKEAVAQRVMDRAQSNATLDKAERDNDEDTVDGGAETDTVNDDRAPVQDVDSTGADTRPKTGSVSRPATKASSRSSRKGSSAGSRTPGQGFTPRYWADSQASTEHRAYHSREAIKMGLDPLGKEKVLNRLGVADAYWTLDCEETPEERLLRRYSAGNRPDSSSHIDPNTGRRRESRPTSRPSTSRESIISADYDILATGGSRPRTRNSASLPGSTGDLMRPDTKGSSYSGPVGILRPLSRGEMLSVPDDEGIEDIPRHRDAQEFGRVPSVDGHSVSRSSVGFTDQLRPESRGPFIKMSHFTRSASGSSAASRVSEVWPDHQSFRDIDGSSHGDSSRPATSDRLASGARQGHDHGHPDGVLPAEYFEAPDVFEGDVIRSLRLETANVPSRVGTANVRFADGSRPGSSYTSAVMIPSESVLDNSEVGQSVNQTLKTSEDPDQD